MGFDINKLVEETTKGQDTSSSTTVKVASGEAAQTKSKSGL
jgi:hypothetical protein